MMFDKEATFSWKQTVAIAQGSVRSSQTYDLGAPGKIAHPPLLGVEPDAVQDIGLGTPVEILIMMTAAFTSLGAATLQVKLNMGTGVDGSYDINAGEITLWDSGAIAKATLIQGYRFPIRFISPPAKLRYMQLLYTVAAADATGGTITAGIVNDRQSNMLP